MSIKRLVTPLLVSLVGLVLVVPGMVVAAAITPLPTPDPIPGSYGLEATKPQPPPKVGATISVPGNGASVSTPQITVSGICPSDDLLVQVYNNGALAGAVMCKNGNFSLQITLFQGENDITAVDYDNLGQAGPTTPQIVVNAALDPSFTAFGTLITLTSNYGRRATNPGATLSWPLLLSGGNGPYAFSTDWGDGSDAVLQSQSLSGTVNISHVYNQSGIYNVTVRVVDKNGVSAFIQLVAVANGNVTAANSTNSANTASKDKTTVTKVLWIPALIMMVLLLPAYWLGRRSELATLKHQLEHDAAKYNEFDTTLPS